MPQNSSCVYSIPNSLSHQVIVSVYKGTPGNAFYIGGDLYTGSATLISQYPNIFATASEEADFFSVAYDYSLDKDAAFQTYWKSGGQLPEGAVENQNYYILQWKWGPKPKEEFDPLIIIPGILGSWEKNGVWVMDPILHTYDNLLNTLRANGYEDGKTLFTLPYDWKESNINTATLLGKKIAAVKTACRCTHVDVAGHSMGGLVAAQYITSGEYKNDVDQLFFVATPLAGAPLAYEAWEAGVINFGRPIINSIMHRIFKNEAKENNYKTVFEYIRNKPISSLQELLPIYNYLYENNTALQYPSGYPRNMFLENLLVAMGEKVFTSTTRAYTILADDLNSNTVSGYIVAPSTQEGVWEHGEPSTILKDVGDGTVPRASIEYVTSPDKTYELVSHIETASSSSPFIFRELNNRSVTSIAGKIYNPLKSADYKILFIKLFSPIDMLITAPDGKRLGREASSTTELEEIPDAFYSGFNTEDEYAVILNPLPGDYTITTVGTGTGPYTILADLMDTSGSHETELSGETSKDKIFTAVLSVSTTSAVTLQPKETPSQPSMSPGQCQQRITDAYKRGWITKQSIYVRLIADCAALTALLRSRETLLKNTPPVAANTALIGLSTSMLKILDHMDLLAKDGTNTKDAVQLITQITTWYREKELHI